MAAAAGISSTAGAATVYWNAASGTWSSTANWWIAASGPDTPLAAPDATSTAVFSANGKDGVTSVQLNSDTSTAGMVFTNTGTTSISSNSATLRKLTIGTGGLTVQQGAGAVTIGSASNPVSLTLSGSQRWTNNSSNVLTVAPSTMALSTNTLTIDNSGTILLAGTINGSWNASIIKTGLGNLILAGANNWGNNPSTTSLQINSGTVTVNTATSTFGNNSSRISMNSGTLNFDNVGATGDVALTVPILTSSGFDNTVSLTNTSPNNQSITFSGFARSGGGIINLVNTGSNSAANGFHFAGRTTAGLVSNTLSGGSVPGWAYFFNGSDFAWVDSAGYVRALNYTSDVGAYTTSDATSIAATGVAVGGGTTNYAEVRGNISAQTTATFTTLSLVNGSDSDQNFTLANGAALTVGGILYTGTGNPGSNAVISGGNALQVLANPAELIVRTVNANDRLTINTRITNGNNQSVLTKSGAGTLILGGANTYTSGTNLVGGTLNLAVAENAGVSGPLGKSGTISFRGGTLQYSAANYYDYSSRFNTAAGQLIRIDTNGQDVRFATALSSSGGTLTKLGTGTLTLAGNSTYGGLTSIQGGVLNLATATALSGAAGDIIIAGGTLDQTVATTIGGNLILTSGSLWQADDVTRSITLSSGKNFTMTGGTLHVTLNADLSDQLIASASNAGTFVITNGLLDLTGSPAIDYTQTYQLLTGFSDGSVSGMTITGYDQDHYVASLSDTGTLSFTAAAIPEAASLAYLAVAGLGLIRRVGRRNGAK